MPERLEEILAECEACRRRAVEEMKRLWPLDSPVFFLRLESQTVPTEGTVLGHYLNPFPRILVRVVKTGKRLSIRIDQLVNPN